MKLVHVNPVIRSDVAEMTWGEFITIVPFKFRRDVSFIRLRRFQLGPQRIFAIALMFSLLGLGCMVAVRYNG